MNKLTVVRRWAKRPDLKLLTSKNLYSNYLLTGLDWVSHEQRI